MSDMEHQEPWQTEWERKFPTRDLGSIDQRWWWEHIREPCGASARITQEADLQFTLRFYQQGFAARGQKVYVERFKKSGDAVVKSNELAKACRRRCEHLFGITEN